MKIEVHDLSYRIQDQRILDEICMHLNDGEFVGLIGPNGSGKSTLLKNIYRVLEPVSGWIKADGRNIYDLSFKETARHISVVNQETYVSFDFTVREIVNMGRYPHKRTFEPGHRRDEHIVTQALERVGMDAHQNRSFDTLSGGEKQRVLIARSLAQQAKFLILDEPTNHLDIRYQLQIMDLVKKLRITALAALHDLNIAAFYCDRIYVMKAGQIVSAGTPEDVLSPATLQDIFSVSAEISKHPVTGKPNITFLPESALQRC